MGNNLNNFCHCENICNNKKDSISLAYKNNIDFSEKPTNYFPKEIIPSFKFIISNISS